MDHTSRGVARKQRRAGTFVFLWRMGFAIVAGLGASVALAVPAGAVILADCTTPNQFCTGDPCVTPAKIEITAVSCVLDFGTRALVLAHPVIVPNNGTLSLTAGSIEVQKLIKGQHTKAAAGDGADVALTTTGDITLKKRIDVSGKNSTGSIVLHAGGNIDLQDQVIARGKRTGLGATGGTVTLHADGVLTATENGKIDVRGKRSKTAGGQVLVTAQSVTVGEIDARGKPGGTVAVSSSAGNVVLNSLVTATGWGFGNGGGGSVTVSATHDITGSQNIVVNGSAPAAGTITLTAGGAVSVQNLKARGIGVPGGTVAAMAASIDGQDTLDVTGSPDGGVIDLQSSAGDITLTKLVASGKDGGGTIHVSSAGDATIQGTTADGEATGGDVRFAAAGVLTLGVNSHSIFSATGTSGGVIDGVATGNLTAQGKYTAANGGCIGLSAGGVLATGSATFDVPLAASCP